MKKLLFLLVILSIVVKAQEEQIANKQFMLGCTNVGNEEEVTHYIQAQGSVWTLSSGSGVITTNQQAYADSIVSVGNADFNSNDWPGFNFIWLDQSFQMPRWGMGFYKVTNSKQNDKYFYLDSRDYAYGSITGGYTNPDFYIFFDNSIQKYKYNRNDPQNIGNGNVIRIWHIFNKTPNTSNLQNYWSNVLVLVNQENHPRIIWGPYQENSLSVQYYKIYKKKGTGNFTLLTTTTGLEYTDQSEIIPTQPSTQVPVYYYVKAFGQLAESNYESGPTNTVSVNVRGGFEKSNINIETNLPAEYGLNQNFPNPFNPSTTINYSIKDEGFVSLIVFDILGREVSTLVKENKQAGLYNVVFDASELTSGVYIYTLNVNGYYKSHKMILTK